MLALPVQSFLIFMSVMVSKSFTCSTLNLSVSEFCWSLKSCFVVAVVHISVYHSPFLFSIHNACNLYLPCYFFIASDSQIQKQGYCTIKFLCHQYETKLNIQGQPLHEHIYKDVNDLFVCCRPHNF